MVPCYNIHPVVRPAEWSLFIGGEESPGLIQRHKSVLPLNAIIPKDWASGRFELITVHAASIQEFSVGRAWEGRDVTGPNNGAQIEEH